MKRENDALRRRIRELERSLNHRRQTDQGRTRSDSASTSVSTSQVFNNSTQGQTAGTDDDDDVVNVGESAGSVGVGGGH